MINPHPKTYCNPLNIAYQYQAEFLSREGADPAAIVFRGEYYLFVSHNSGYWWSPDLADWHFVYSDMPEIGKWAPAVCVVDDVMYLTHSQEGAIYKSSDPKSGKWEYVSHPVAWGDPALFTDDDGRVYCYYGCSDKEPIYAVELDPKNDMALLNGPVVCLQSDGAVHGFEVPGDQNDKPQNSCWLEGAWMNKHDGKYYLQYAAPGTEYAAYADGCYVSDKPLGPFTFCENSPISFKASGNMVGAGHGSLLRDLNGRYWKFDTTSISINHMFERRVVMAPAAFDAHGNLVTNMERADYPTYVPHADVDHYRDPHPAWELVSYGAAATASSTLGEHTPDLAADENMRTWWCAKSADAGEWLQLDLGKLCTVNALQLNFADQDLLPVGGRDNAYCYRYTIAYSQDGDTWQTLVDHTDATGAPHTAVDTSHDYYELNNPIDVRYVRVTNQGEIPAGGKFAVSGLRLFGNGGGEAPAHAPTGLRVDRPQADERTATVTWDAVEGAQGYVLRYGCHEDSLNLHYQVIGDTAVTVRNLNMGVGYWFTVDAYNDSGYVKGAATVKVD